MGRQWELLPHYVQIGIFRCLRNRETIKLQLVFEHDYKSILIIVFIGKEFVFLRSFYEHRGFVENNIRWSFDISTSTSLEKFCPHGSWIIGKIIENDIQVRRKLLAYIRNISVAYLPEENITLPSDSIQKKFSIDEPRL